MNELDKIVSNRFLLFSSEIEMKLAIKRLMLQLMKDADYDPIKFGEKVEAL